MNNFVEIGDNCPVEVGDLLIFPDPRRKPLFLLILQEHEKHRNVYLVFDLNQNDIYHVCLDGESFYAKKANKNG